MPAHDSGPAVGAGPSLCDRCWAPGACCRNMMLYHVDGVDLFQRPGEDAATLLPSRLAEARLPFDPLAPGMLHRSPDGEPVLIWMFACRELGPDGRCGIYASRPAICRTYEPASDGLCVHHGGSEAGDASGCTTFALAPHAI